MENSIHFKHSFESRLKDSEERKRLMPLFDFLCKGLEPIKVIRSLVDVSVKQGLIEFNLNMGGDVCVSVQKNLDTMEDDYVIFTVSLDGVLRTADCLPLGELQVKLLQLQKVIEDSELRRKELSNYYACKLDKQLDDLWDNGMLDQKRLDEIAKMDLHTDL